jgi:hypothetical protein
MKLGDDSSGEQPLQILDSAFDFLDDQDSTCDFFGVKRHSMTIEEEEDLTTKGEQRYESSDEEVRGYMYYVATKSYTLLIQTVALSQLNPLMTKVDMTDMFLRKFDPVSNKKKSFCLILLFRQIYIYIQFENKLLPINNSNYLIYLYLPEIGVFRPRVLVPWKNTILIWLHVQPSPTIILYLLICTNAPVAAYPARCKLMNLFSIRTETYVSLWLQTI